QRRTGLIAVVPRADLQARPPRLVRTEPGLASLPLALIPECALALDLFKDGALNTDVVEEAMTCVHARPVSPIGAMAGPRRFRRIRAAAGLSPGLAMVHHQRHLKRPLVVVADHRRLRQERSQTQARWENECNGNRDTGTARQGSARCARAGRLGDEYARRAGCRHVGVQPR